MAYEISKRELPLVAKIAGTIISFLLGVGTFFNHLGFKVQVRQKVVKADQ